MDRQTNYIEAVILAAGGSRRMGEQKLLKKLDGKTIVRRAAETALKSRVSRVVVVVGSDAERVRAELADLPVDTIENHAWQDGQGTSVACGVSALGGCEAAVLMVGDQPFVTEEQLNRLIDAWAAGDECTKIYASAVNGVRGNPTLFDKTLFSDLMELTGDKGARQLFGRYPVQLVEQVDDKLFLDTDTEDAFRMAELEWLLRYGKREAFPLLKHSDIAYLDSAATSQTAEYVLAAVDSYERTTRSNVHRGIYPLAEASDAAYEAAREDVAHFFGIRPEETIFTHGATEALNLAILGWGRKNLKPGDLVLVDQASHHANIVPWQMLERSVGIRLVFLPLTEEGTVDRSAYSEWLREKPKAVSLTHGSNVTGRIQDIRAMADEAHEAGAVVIADFAQTAGHLRLHFPEFGVDFAALSAHKMYGPFGIGLLWASPAVIGQLEPIMGGGGMIESVTVDGVSFAQPPMCYEAGTPNVSGAVGFAAACRFIEEIGPEKIEAHGRALCAMAEEGLSQIPNVHLVGGTAGGRGSLVSFTIDGVHPHDAADALAGEGVCVRAGHHCAMPLHRALKIPASIRASFGIYSTRGDVERLLRAVVSAKEVMGIGE